MIKRLEKYEIIQELGHGGMATVYKARDTKLNRYVAVKVLHKHLRDSKEARARFEREAQSVAKLKHPRILEIYDYSGEESEESYFAAELLTGPTLKAFIRGNGPLPAEIAACFALQIASALKLAHEHNVIHRDVKPENVMLHENKGLKLTDFGIAHVADTQTFTATGQILGSPGHMAPEQIDGRGCDARTDIFSLGTVLFYMTTSKLPFEGRNTHHVLKRILDGDFTDPLRLCPSMGKPFSDIIAKCMAHEPSDRYVSIDALEQDIQSFLLAVGIDDADLWTKNFIQSPIETRKKIEATVIEKLIIRGEKYVQEKKNNLAMEDFNRVLALDENHPTIARLLQKLGAQKTKKKILIGVLGFMLGFSGIGAASFAFSVFTKNNEEQTRHTPSKLPEELASFPKKNLKDDVKTKKNSPAQENPDTKNLKRNASKKSSSAKSGSNKTVSSAPRTVVFRPNPQNVTIQIDGGDPKAFGPSFYQTNLSPGKHQFVIKGAGSCCVDEKFSMNVPPGPGKTIIAKNLKLKPAGIYITSNVPAKVSLNKGKVTGRARQVLRYPMEKSLETIISVEVTADGFKPYKSSTKLRAGKMQQLQVQLIPE